MFHITLRSQQRVARPLDLEDPTGAVFVQVDRRRVGKQLLVDLHEPAGNRGIQAALGLFALDRADLLFFAQNGSRRHRPVQKIDVLQEPHGVGREAKPPDAFPRLGPHVVLCVVSIRRKLGLEIPHHEDQRLAHV
jgi:hypothetical protein